MRQIVYMLMLALLMPALADQGVPNLVGNWTSCTPGVSGVILGAPDHYPKDQLANSSMENVRFAESKNYSIVIQEQKGRMFAGTRFVTERPDTTETILGCVDPDNRSLHMADEDSIIDGKLISPTEFYIIVRGMDDEGMLVAMERFYKIEIKSVPALRVASLQAKGLPFEETVPRAFEELGNWTATKGISPSVSSPRVAIYYDDPSTTNPADVRFKVAVQVPQNTSLVSEGNAAVEDLAEGQVASLTLTGSYDDLSLFYDRLYAWIYQSGYTASDAPREVYVNWDAEIPPEDWVTEIQVPITI